MKSKIKLLTAIMAIVFMGSSTFMAQAKADAGFTKTYNKSAKELFALVDFHQPSEAIMPPIASSKVDGKGVGALKINNLKDNGGEIVLQLVHYAPESYAFNYVIRSAPLPVKNYVGQVRVKDLGDGKSQLSWQGVFKGTTVSQEEADKMVQGFLNSIADKIAQK